MMRVTTLILSTACLLFSSAHAEVAALDTSLANQEWRSYIEPMLPIGERMVPLIVNQQDAQTRQELYQLLFSEMSMAYVGLFSGDAEHPDFWPQLNTAFNVIGPNPDATYYLAPVAGDGIYKISGYRGSVRIVDFQIGAGALYPKGEGPMAPTFANYDIDKLHINKKDGTFEVILSKERPAGYKGDWWQLDPQATYVEVRQIAYDWIHEVDGRFAIQRLDRPASRPRQGTQDIEANLKRIPGWAENYTKLALALAARDRANGVINKVFVLDMNNIGGSTAQRYIEGTFDLQPDEALIYETNVPKHCRYWGITLTDGLWRAIGWVDRQSNLNGSTARLDKDGRFRAVIAGTDPGVPNWLDTAGYQNGNILGRWRECDSAPVPTIIKIKLADIRNHLPADTPTVSDEDRDTALRLRTKGTQLRRRW